MIPFFAAEFGRTARIGLDDRRPGALELMRWA
jgi:hypothetical protein